MCSLCMKGETCGSGRVEEKWAIRNGPGETRASKVVESLSISISMRG